MIVVWYHTHSSGHLNLFALYFVMQNQSFSIFSLFYFLYSHLKHWRMFPYFDMKVCHGVRSSQEFILNLLAKWSCYGRFKGCVSRLVHLKIPQPLLSWTYPVRCYSSEKIRKYFLPSGIKYRALKLIHWKRRRREKNSYLDIKESKMAELFICMIHSKSRRVYNRLTLYHWTKLGTEWWGLGCSYIYWKYEL